MGKPGELEEKTPEPKHENTPEDCWGTKTTAAIIRRRTFVPRRVAFIVFDRLFNLDDEEVGDDRVAAETLDDASGFEETGLTD